MCQTFWFHSSVFALEKQLKNISFQSAFTFKRFIGGYFQETRAPTSRNYVAEQGTVMPNRSKTFQTLGRTLPFLLWKNNLKI